MLQCVSKDKIALWARNALNHARLEVRVLALFILGKHGTNDPDNLGLIASAMDDRDLRIRVAAVRASTIISPAVLPQMLSRLLQAINDEAALVRQMALLVIARHCDSTSDHVPVESIMSALNDTDRAVRLAAAECLGSCGKYYDLALPRLREMLSQEDDAAGAIIRNAIDPLQAATPTNGKR